MFELIDVVRRNIGRVEYGILDYSDFVVEYHTKESVLRYLKMGVEIKGLTTDNIDFVNVNKDILLKDEVGSFKLIVLCGKVRRCNGNIARVCNRLGECLFSIAYDCLEKGKYPVFVRCYNHLNGANRYIEVTFEYRNELGAYTRSYVLHCIGSAKVQPVLSEGTFSREFGRNPIGWRTDGKFQARDIVIEHK